MQKTHPDSIGHGGFNDIVARAITECATWKGNFESEISVGLMGANVQIEAKGNMYFLIRTVAPCPLF
jgi:hypothetical protein